MKVCVLGAGNVASHLTRAFLKAGHEFVVWNRSEATLSVLREELKCFCVTNIHELPKDADIYLISVKDDAVGHVAQLLSTVVDGHGAVVAHTAGSLSLSVLDRCFPCCGALYPMQTFSKTNELDYSQIPFFIEGGEEAQVKLRRLAESVSETVYELDSELRGKLHLACVFACNFTNHCLAVSEQLLKDMNLPFSTMFPLLKETFDKVRNMSPLEAQTGPAVREDAAIMDVHLKMLKERPDEKEIYSRISQNIIKYKNNDKLRS